MSDTTLLLLLLKIDRIDLLEKLFGQVLIPQAVFDELTADEVRRCVAGLQRAGRHIGQKHDQLLLDKLND